MTKNAFSQLEIALEQFIRQRLTSDPAHDINHIQRVVIAAKQFAKDENADLAVILPAAWLHDCVILKKNDPLRYQASSLAAQEAIRYLRTIDYPAQYFNAISHAIEAHSYSANIPVHSIEAAIVQDADRIDALGAIGIARCIQVSSGFQSQLYSTDDPFGQSRQWDDKDFCIDHFFVKLFTLEATMNTTAARKEAHQRTQYMKGFLTQLGHEIGADGTPTF